MGLCSSKQIKDANTKSNKRVKYLRTDGGGEYTGALTPLLSSYGLHISQQRPTHLNPMAFQTEHSTIWYEQCLFTHICHNPFGTKLFNMQSTSRIVFRIQPSATILHSRYGTIN